MAVLSAAVEAGRAAVRPRLDRQGRRAVQRHGRDQAPRGVARRGRRHDDRPDVRRGPLRQRPRLGRQRAADLPEPARERRADHDHPSGDDPLLHDDAGGRLADPRRRGGRAARRPVRPRHGRAGPDPRHGPRPDPSDRPRRGQRPDPVHRPATRREAPRAPLLPDREGRADRGRQDPPRQRRGPAGRRRARARRLLELALGDRDDELRTTLFELVSDWPEPEAGRVPVPVGRAWSSRSGERSCRRARVAVVRSVEAPGDARADSA